MRLIDADTLCKVYKESGSECTGNACEVPTMPTIDAVSVVRCCDCKHCDIGTNYFESWCYCKAWRHSVNPTDFCSYGERK